MSTDHSALEDVDETIERSRKFIQQSREFTLKNNERKAMLEEKCKRVLSPETINFSALRNSISPVYNNSSHNNPESSLVKQEILRQTSPDCLDLEKAKLEIQKQRSQIIALESQIKNLEFENENLRKELKSTTDFPEKSCEIISLGSFNGMQRIYDLEKNLRTNSNAFTKLKRKIKRVETVAKKRSKKKIHK